MLLFSALLSAMNIFRISLSAFWLILFSAVFVLPAVAAAVNTDNSFPAGLRACGSGTGMRSLTGDRLILEDGRTIMLAEIKAPEFWPDGSPYKSWPHGRTAQQALEALIKHEPLTLWCVQKRKNNLGDLTAHVKLTGDRWLQQLLLQRGHGYFMPHSHRPAAAKALRHAENTARTGKHGLWAKNSATIVSADSNGLRPGWFQIVRGKIMAENRLRDRIYLNFGPDWRSDFTIEIPKRLYRRFGLAKTPGTRTAKIGLTGKNIEVRGWVEWSGGPKIILEDAEQLVVLPPPSAGAR